VMAWVNEISLSGRVVRDAKRGNNGPWRFTLRQSGGKKRNGDGYHPDEVFPVASWHDTGEQVKAGQEILVKGRLRHERWTDADGGERERLTVIAESIELPDQPAVESTVATAPAKVVGKFPITSAERPPIKAAPLRPVTASDPISDSDIPF
jgi:single-stranded DNA-binding protein